MLRLIQILLLFCTLLFSQQTDTLYVLQTTDVHGNIYPYDYFNDRPDNTRGLAKVYSRVKEFRKNHKNVMLVDAGDLIQGTPLAYYFNKNNRELIHPMILTMNYMGYDAFTVGNHDIEQGLFVYLQAEKNANFPWISANAVLEDQRNFYKPYTIIEQAGIKVGILGLTTPGIPMWLDKRLYPGITWEDMVKTAQKHIAELRAQVDIVIGVFHAGFNAEYSRKQSEAAGIPNENASGLVAEQIPEFDAIFAGHSHRAGPMKVGRENEKVFDSAPLRLNAGRWGEHLAIAKFVISKNDNSWQVQKKSGWIESMEKIPPAQSILDLTEYYHEQTLEYIRTRIGELSAPLSAKDARFKDTPLIELINKAQMDYTGADIAFAASFNDGFTMESGPISIKDIYGMYRYENFLYALEMNGQQIKDFLEYSSRYFLNNDGKLGINKDIPGYNYDMAEGLNYQVDIRQPVGKRIVKMIDPKTQKPFDLDKTYMVALNSYRASGGGGHLDASGARNNPIIFKSNEEMRNILAKYIQKQGKINPRADDNWRIIGIKP